MSETSPPVVAVHVASRGPRFFRGEDDSLMFEITLDHRSKIGPRPAVEADKHNYPKAWATFETGALMDAEPLTPVLSTEDHPKAKAEHDRQAAERQERMDRKRSGGL